MERKQTYARKFGVIAESLAKVPPRVDRLTALEREGVLHVVQVAVDAAMDVVAMRVRDLGHEVSDDYHNLATLRDGGALEPAMAEELRKLNGLRNAIVHKYNTFEASRVFESLAQIKATLLKFVERVETET